MMISDRYQLVFVLGSQRSGTTLLGQVLGAPVFSFLIDEPDGVYDWFAGVFEQNLDEDDPGLDFQRLCLRARQKYSEGNRAARCDGEGRLRQHITHIVFKVPNLTYSAKHIAEFFPKAICVFPFRDIRDVVVSMAKLNWIPMVENQLRLLKGHIFQDDEVNEDVDLLSNANLQSHEAHALVAKTKMSLFTDFRRHGLNTVTMKYEDFVRDPDTMCPQLLRDVAMGAQTGCPDHSAVYGGLGPGLTLRRRKIDKVSLNQWPDLLTREQETRVWELVGGFMKRLGYSRGLSTSKPSDWERLNSPLKQSPVVVTGSTGDELSLLSTLVRSLNVFMTNETDDSADWFEWVQIIKQIAVFNQIANVNERQPPFWQKQLRDGVARILSSAHWDGQQSWGWALPVTMLALPQVLSAFPEARIVHLVRHPVDCSLHGPRGTSRPDQEIENKARAAAYRSLGWPHARIANDPEHIRKAANWLYQVNAATHLGAQLESGRYLEIRYEDICANPDAGQRALARFLGLPAPAIALETGNDYPQKLFYPHGDTRALEIWEVCGAVASRFGYDLSPD